jgi:hypothetical protein
MKTTLFDWAEKNGYGLVALGKLLGYSARHLRRVRDGEQPVTPAFAGRVVLVLGEWARSLFLDPMPLDSNETVLLGQEES